MSSIAMQMTKKMMKEQYALQGTNRPDGSFDRAARNSSLWRRKCAKPATPRC